MAAGPPDTVAPETGETKDLSEPLRPPGATISLPPGSWVGRYVVLQELGRGGMGAVYAAYDSELDRRVALKFLRGVTAKASEEWRARLMREAKAMARLSHPNVVTLYDAGVSSEGRMFLAMELVEGGTLDDWLKAEPRSCPRILSVFCEAGEGLAAAHRAGIIHRDFKLENVLFGKDGRPRVTDFGIARSAEQTADDDPAEGYPSVTGSSSDSKLTRTGSMIGTPGYMAPEQYENEVEIDARADIFAFSAALYRALYGQRPFEGGTVDAIAQSTREGKVRSPPKGTAVPAWVHVVLLWGLASERDARPASMAELLAALRADPEHKRRRRLLAVGIVALPFLVAAASIGVGHHRKALATAACVAEGASLTAMWTPAARAFVKSALDRAPIPDALERAGRAVQLFDDFVAGSRLEQTSSCLATHVDSTQTPSAHEKRSACLEAGSEQLGTFVELLSTDNPAIQRKALEFAYALPPPKLCDGVDALGAYVPLSADPGLRATSQEVRRLLVRARVLVLSGQHAEALPLSEQAAELARAAGDTRKEAEALFEVADGLEGLGDTTASMTASRQAICVAERGGADRIAALAALDMAYEFGNDLDRIEDARDSLAFAAAKLARHGLEDTERYVLLGTTIVVEEDSVESNPTPEGIRRVLEMNERYIERYSERFGATSPGVCNAYAYEATMEEYSLDLDKSIGTHQKAILCRETLYGPHNPNLAMYYGNLAEVLNMAGQFHEGASAAQHALDLRASRPPSDQLRSWILGLLSASELGDGRVDAAEEHARLGIAAAEKQGEVGRANLREVLYAEGEARAARGDWAGARDSCARAVALQDAIDRPSAESLYPRDALRCLGQAQLALGDVKGAREHLERTASLHKRKYLGNLARARFALARALVVGPKPDPVRAKELATQAADELRPLVEAYSFLHGDLDAIEAWLVKRADWQGPAAAERSSRAR